MQVADAWINKIIIKIKIMLFGTVLMGLGIFLIYLILDFILICGADIHKFGDKWIKRTLWLWLPIHALVRLTKEVILKEK